MCYHVTTMKNIRKLPGIVIYSYLKYGAVCISWRVFTIIIINFLPIKT